LSISPLPIPSLGQGFSYSGSGDWSAGVDPSAWSGGAAATGLSPGLGAPLPQSLADLIEVILLAAKAGLP